MVGTAICLVTKTHLCPVAWWQLSSMPSSVDLKPSGKLWVLAKCPFPERVICCSPESDALSPGAPSADFVAGVALMCVRSRISICAPVLVLMLSCSHLCWCASPRLCHAFVVCSHVFAHMCALTCALLLLRSCVYSRGSYGKCKGPVFDRLLIGVRGQVTAVYGTFTCWRGCLPRLRSRSRWCTCSDLVVTFRGVRKVFW